MEREVIPVPKRCQQIIQIKINYIKPTKYADFSHRKHRKYIEKRYSDIVRVVEQLVLVLLLQSLNNCYLIQ